MMVQDSQRVYIQYTRIWHEDVVTVVGMNAVLTIPAFSVLGNAGIRVLREQPRIAPATATVFVSETIGLKRIPWLALAIPIKASTCTPPWAALVVVRAVDTCLTLSVIRDTSARSLGEPTRIAPATIALSVSIGTGFAIFPFGSKWSVHLVYSLAKVWRLGRRGREKSGDKNDIDLHDVRIRLSLWIESFCETAVAWYRTFAVEVCSQALFAFLCGSLRPTRACDSLLDDGGNDDSCELRYDW